MSRVGISYDKISLLWLDLKCLKNFQKISFLRESSNSNSKCRKMRFFENSSNISNRATEARFCRTIFLRGSFYQKLSKLFVKKRIKKIVIFHAYLDISDPSGNVNDFRMTYFMHGSIHAIFARKCFLEKTIKN